MPLRRVGVGRAVAAPVWLIVVLHFSLLGCATAVEPSGPRPAVGAPSTAAPTPGSRTDPVFQPPGENWVILSESRREVIWGDPTNRVRDWQRVRLPIVINNREVESPYPAMKSMRGLSEFDCATRLHRSIEVTAFDQPGGTGRVLERSTTPSGWSPVAQTAHLQRALVRACAP